MPSIGGRIEASSRIHPERHTNPYTFTDKIFSKVQEKAIEKIADSIVSPVSLSYKHIPRTMNSSHIPGIQMSSYARTDIFGIEGYICRSCLTIKPAILTYSRNPKRQNESLDVIYLDSCVTCSTQMSMEEKSYYLNYNLTNGITPLLFSWIREYWSDLDRLKLIALRISNSKTESPGYHPNIVNLGTTYSSPGKIAHLTIACQRNLPPSIRRTVSLKLEELHVIELKTFSSENSDRSIPLSRIDSIPLIRAIRESEYQITSVSAVYFFLYHTKFSTFGLFRLNLNNTLYGNTDDDITNDAYFITLVPKEFDLDIEYSSEMVDHEVRMDSAAATARLS